MYQSIIDSYQEGEDITEKSQQLVSLIPLESLTEAQNTGKDYLKIMQTKVDALLDNLKETPHLFPLICTTFTILHLSIKELKEKDINNVLDNLNLGEKDES